MAQLCWRSPDLAGGSADGALQAVSGGRWEGANLAATCREAVQRAVVL